MEFLNKTSKAVAGFVAGVVSVIIGRIATEGAVLPDLNPFDTAGWAALVGAGVLAYLGVYIAPRNQLTSKQVQEDVPKLSMVARKEVAETALDSLPAGVQNNIVAYRQRPTE